MLATEVLSPDVTVAQLVVSVVVSGFFVVFGLLAKRAVDDFGRKLDQISTSVEKAVATIHAHETTLALLEQRVAAIERAVERRTGEHLVVRDST